LHGQSLPFGKGLRQQFDLFFRQLGLPQHNAGDVATRLRQAFYVPMCNRVEIIGSNDYRKARAHCSLNRGLRGSDDRIRLGANHLRNVARDLCRRLIGGPLIDD